jgi:hypothetical protein
MVPRSDYNDGESGEKADLPTYQMFSSSIKIEIAFSGKTLHLLF